MLITIFFIFLLLPLLLIFLIEKYDEKIQKLLNGLQEDKKLLFKGYSKEKELPTPKIEKKCEKCGRNLKSDSKYCDFCGSKI